MRVINQKKFYVYEIPCLMHYCNKICDTPINFSNVISTFWFQVIFILFLKIALTIWDMLCFHTHFRIACSISVNWFLLKRALWPLHWTPRSSYRYIFECLSKWMFLWHMRVGISCFAILLMSDFPSPLFILVRNQHLTWGWRTLASVAL